MYDQAHNPVSWATVPFSLSGSLSAHTGGHVAGSTLFKPHDMILCMYGHQGHEHLSNILDHTCTKGANADDTGMCDGCRLETANFQQGDLYVVRYRAVQELLRDKWIAMI